MSAENDRGERALATLHEAVVGLRQAEAESAVHDALAADVPPRRVLVEGLTAAMQTVGRRWDDGQMFLPQVMVAARIFARCSKLVEPRLLASGSASTGPRVLLATVQSDVHDLGKSIVGSMLRARGCQVEDLGKDVGTDAIVDAVVESKPRVVGLSAMLTSTMEHQRSVIEGLVRAGVRADVRVLVGGAPVTSKWAERIGADGYGASAADAVRLIEDLTEPAGG